MSGWAIVAAGLAGAIALPWLLEALRRPVRPGRIRLAHGEYCQLSHGATYCRWFGKEGDPVLVLIHGLSTPSWVFMGLTRGLTRLGFRVLIYDLYGRGLSARPKVAHDRALYLGQLEELLQAQEVRGPVALLGYSMGGAIATAFAARHPERVRRLFLLAPAGIALAPMPLLARATRAGVFGDWLWGLAGARYLRRSARKDARGASVIADLTARIRRETRSRGYLPALLSSMRHMLDDPLEDEHRALAQAGMPVLAIWGERDEVIPLRAMARLTEWNHAAHHAVIPGAGHALVHSHPREVLAAIAEDLRDD